MEDEWQCTPLYYACFGGHYKICEYLLLSGAICDPHTFQGERCLYGALTDEVRTLLRKHRVTKSVNETRPFLAFMSQALQRAEQGGAYTDLCIRVKYGGQPTTDTTDTLIWAHRIVLAARSPWFDQVIKEQARRLPKHPLDIKDTTEGIAPHVWELVWPNTTDKVSTTITLPLVHPNCIRAVLHYLYTGDTTIIHDKQYMRSSVPKELYQAMYEFCQQIHLDELAQVYQRALEQQSGIQLQGAVGGATEEQTRRLQQDLENFLCQRVLSARLPIYPEEEHNVDSDNVMLEMQRHRLTQQSQFNYADICIQIGGYLYPAHRLFVTLRCDFINMMFHSAFANFVQDVRHKTQAEETNVSDSPLLEMVDLSILDDLCPGGQLNQAQEHSDPLAGPCDGTIDCASPVVIELVFKYLYTDRCSIPVTALHATLTMADALLLERLRSLAAVSIGSLPITASAAADAPTIAGWSVTSKSNTALGTDNADVDPVQSLPFNIYKLYREAARARIERVEQWCTRWFAEYLPYVAYSPQFLHLVSESAAEIRNRQEVDSVVMIDEIRYWLQEHYGSLSDDEDEDVSSRLFDESGKPIPDDQLNWSERHRQRNALLEMVLTKLGLEA
jgi:ankyrin repeat/BTB/POZ domain-containing protein 1